MAKPINIKNLIKTKGVVNRKVVKGLLAGDKPTKTPKNKLPKPAKVKAPKKVRF